MMRWTVLYANIRIDCLYFSFFFVCVLWVECILGTDDPCNWINFEFFLPPPPPGVRVFFMQGCGGGWSRVLWSDCLVSEFFVLFLGVVIRESGVLMVWLGALIVRQCDIFLSDGSWYRAAVPSGASTGQFLQLWHSKCKIQQCALLHALVQFGKLIQDESLRGSYWWEMIVVVVLGFDIICCCNSWRCLRSFGTERWRKGIHGQRRPEG